MSLEKGVNERLANFIRLDVRTILSSTELKNEYVELHLLIEGFKPSCTGCSAKSKLASWKKKYERKDLIIKKFKAKIMSNTFKLKKGRLRLSIPFSGSVITENSSDELVWSYLNNKAITKEEKERRESFFEILPKKIKKEKAEKVVEKFVEKTTNKLDNSNKK